MNKKMFKIYTRKYIDNLRSIIKCKYILIRYLNNPIQVQNSNLN